MSASSGIRAATIAGIILLFLVAARQLWVGLWTQDAREIGEAFVLAGIAYYLAAAVPFDWNDTEEGPVPDEVVELELGVQRPLLPPAPPAPPVPRRYR